jgi:hypothetical protein
METFQRIVIIIAIILLIVCLVFIGITLSKTTDQGQWPPIVGRCPDYWVDSSGNGSNCINVRDLGTCTSGGNGVSPSGNHIAMNFTVAPYVGNAGTCAKYTWANSCGVTWDGITSGITNPCATLANTASAQK